MNTCRYAIVRRFIERDPVLGIRHRPMPGNPEWAIWGGTWSDTDLYVTDGSAMKFGKCIRQMREGMYAKAGIQIRLVRSFDPKTFAMEVVEEHTFMPRFEAEPEPEQARPGLYPDPNDETYEMQIRPEEDWPVEDSFEKDKP